MSRLQMFGSRAVGAAVVLLLAGNAQAQLSSATIKGKIRSGEAAATPGMNVTAVNVASGFSYKTVTLADGSYTITGLPPGVYEIRISEPSGTAKSEPLTLAVGDSATVDLTLTKVEEKLREIVITGSRQRMAVKTSEIGANVSQQMIAAMPAPTHNFLSSADLVPGAIFEQDQGSGFTNVRSSGQNRDGVNVFIDGVSQKNNIMHGGIPGQDTSRGNPFPQSAIQEYKIITQNYKAEFDQVGSAAVTAVTKSGTNEFHGDAYVDRTETGWRAKTPYENTQERLGNLLMPSNKNEFGLSLGGPIKTDAIHFFIAYDGKDINDSRQLAPAHLDLLPAGKGLVPEIANMRGSFIDSFSEHLFFAKVDAQVAENQTLTASMKLRFEADHVPEDASLSAPRNDKKRINDDHRFNVTHDWDIGSGWTSQGKADYQWARWSPQSNLQSPEFKYFVSTADPKKLTGAAEVISMGGSPDSQDKRQSGLTVSEDVTFSGIANHLFKGGAKVRFLNYDMRQGRVVNEIDSLIDTATGWSYYNSTTGQCTGTNVGQNGTASDQCKIISTVTTSQMNYDNTQIGLYAQDDWDVTQRLQVNIGARWDVETNMMNNGYVTPDNVMASLNKLDTRSFAGQTARPGQTYADSLAKGGIHIADYISDGRSRKAYLGEIAPRIGFSWDILGDKNTVVYGGYGRSYDRTIADRAMAELAHNQPNGEMDLINNTLKMPYSDQFGIGVRQAIFNWNFEAALTELDAHNQFQWWLGNRDLNGGIGGTHWADVFWGGAMDGRQVILGDFVGESRTRTFMLKLEKPYTKASGWAATVAYVYAEARTTEGEWNNDEAYDWFYGRPGATKTFHPAINVDPHRLVIAAMTDKLIPWGFVLSGKFIYGAGAPLRIWGCPTSTDGSTCTADKGGPVPINANNPEYKQFDLGLAKRYSSGAGTFTIRADILNVFNWVNDTYSANAGAGNAVAAGKTSNRFGLSDLAIDTPNSVLRGPPRTVKIAASYNF